jgi:hypothetical protein
MTDDLSDDDFAAQLRALGGQEDAAGGTSQTAEALASSPVYQQLREYHAATRQKQVDDAIQGSASQAQQATRQRRATLVRPAL